MHPILMDIQRPQVIDATRVRDGQMVVIKRIDKSVHPHEVDIARLLSPSPLKHDPRNHCCPVLDVLQDPHRDEIQLMVMPILRQYNEPRFETVGEAVEFFRQALEVCVLFSLLLRLYN